MSNENVKDAFKSQQKVAFMSLVSELPNAIAQLAVAVLSGSLLIALDAIDSVSNLIQAVLSFFLSKKLQGDDSFKYDYGMGKIEAFGSFIAAVFLYIALTAILTASVFSLLRPSEPQDILWLAIGIKVINVAIDAVLLHRQIKTVKGITSGFVKSNTMFLVKNLVFDSTTLLAVTAAFLLRNVSGIGYLEPTVCIACALYIAIQNIKIIKEASADLLDKTLDEQTQLKVMKCVAGIWNDIEGFHGVRTRRSGHIVYIDLMVSFGGGCSYDKIYQTYKVFDKAIKDVIPDGVSAIVIGER
ncbi:MAG: cation diffusion facilitator family transporter [Oscillospiraceae bacterium]|nr:cation diffusion facilitator family transporter [Oscillospiraceae bacterium]